MQRAGQNPSVDAETLASRTLELVDIPSESRREADLAAYVRSAVPVPVLYDDGDILLFGRRRAGVRSWSSRATSTRFRLRGISRGASRTASSTGSEQAT
jgi:hypothetical protein